MAQPEQLFQPSGKLQSVNRISAISAIRDHVIVTDLSFAARKLSSGIQLLGDDGKSEGIRPRWARVYLVGPDQSEIKVGQWVFVEHGRWTRAFKLEIAGEHITVHRVDTKGIIGVQDEAPSEDDTISTAVAAERKTR